ncbi:MAG TPA: hypothetical protein VNU73_07715 [Steroidobacteraceae bacterium]|nr:hypothetical protein [Steroidobacteraceae bacterium]
MTLQKISALALAFVLLPLAVLAADAPNISGTWTASFDTQIGKQDYTYTFVVKGSQLTGRAKSANGDTEISDGKVDGTKVTFVENFTFQGMPLRIVYTGTVTSADQIDFTRDVAGIAMEKLTAKRAK